MNNQYKISLDTRGGRDFLHTCPKCEQQTFTRYVYNDTNKDVADDVGRCSREINCAYHRPPREHFKGNPSRSGQSYVSKTKAPKIRAPKVQTQSKEVRFDTISYEHVEASMKDTLCYNSFFAQWLYNLFEKDYTRESINDVISRYKLGGSDMIKDAVVFWQIDINNSVRTGKIMLYNPETGKRIKNPLKASLINWVHFYLKKKKILSESFVLGQCFFGEHLLSANPDATVAVFEGEKSAIVASLVFPELICIASGGLNAINEQKCEVLKDRNVIFFPDLGCYSKWTDKVNKIAKQVFFKSYSINNILESNATEAEIEQGLDLCDYIIKELETIKSIKI